MTRTELRVVRELHTQLQRLEGHVEQISAKLHHLEGERQQWTNERRQHLENVRRLIRSKEQLLEALGQIALGYYREQVSAETPIFNPEDLERFFREQRGH